MESLAGAFKGGRRARGRKVILTGRGAHRILRGVAGTGQAGVMKSHTKKQAADCALGTPKGGDAQYRVGPPKGGNAQHRSADALRENLRKRKTQAKARQKQESDTCP